MKLRLASLITFLFLFAACEKKPASYVLKTPAGHETSNHFTDIAPEQPRKYIRVMPFEFRREKRIIENRSYMQKRRNKHYFPRR